jgi:hypothetical protein
MRREKGSDQPQRSILTVGPVLDWWSLADKISMFFFASGGAQCSRD